MIQTIGYIGERLDLLIRQGADFGPFRMTVNNPDNSPVDLTGVTFRGHIRKLPTSTILEAELNFVITDAPAGKVEFFLTAQQTADIVAGLTIEEPDSKYFYDIEYQNDGDRILPLLYGDVALFREVTR